MKKNSIFLYLYLLFFVGCATAPIFIDPIVTGIIMWKDGEAHKYYNEKPIIMYRSTQTALRELGYNISESQATQDGYYILAEGEDKFKISIYQVKNDITNVKIRINLMGNKSFAELIYHQIDANTNTINFDDEGKPTKKRKSLLTNFPRS